LGWFAAWRHKFYSTRDKWSFDKFYEVSLIMKDLVGNILGN